MFQVDSSRNSLPARGSRSVQPRWSCRGAKVTAFPPAILESNPEGLDPEWTPTLLDFFDAAGDQGPPWGAGTQPLLKGPSWVSMVLAEVRRSQRSPGDPRDESGRPRTRAAPNSLGLLRRCGRSAENRCPQEGPSDPQGGQSARLPRGRSSTPQTFARKFGGMVPPFLMNAFASKTVSYTHLTLPTILRV